MSLEFSKAKNQSLTCSYNDIYLHSSYNPEQESSRIASSVTFDFIPENIFILEGALGYIIKPLKEKYPSTKIYAIRYTSEIKSIYEYEKEFIYNSNEQLKNELYNYFGEEKLLNSYFFSWPPSSKVFSEKDSSMWNLIKELLTECQMVLTTREYFSTRWLKNSINFFSNIKNFRILKKIESPILICASGPSLKNQIDYIKKYQDKFFIIACSSSIKFLIKNNINIDLCITTDGGYYAKKHLQCLLDSKKIYNIALTSESNVPNKIFDKHNIIPLAYLDNLDNYIMEKLKIKYNIAKRNGTITGTALELALSLTNNDILLCGCDLENNKTFPHTQPNELEENNCIFDNKIATKEKRIFIQNQSSIQLQVYKNYFINKSYSVKNVYRISNNYNYKNSLGQIPDINWTEYLKNKNFLTIDKSEFFTDIASIKTKKHELYKIFTLLITNEEFIKIYFPAFFVSKNRKSTTIEYNEKLNNKITSIKNYIEKLNQKVFK